MNKVNDIFLMQTPGDCNEFKCLRNVQNESEDKFPILDKYSSKKNLTHGHHVAHWDITMISSSVNDRIYSYNYNTIRFIFTEYICHNVSSESVSTILYIHVINWFLSQYKLCTKSNVPPL